MKVALYHPWVYLKGGIERLLLEVAERSRHDVTLYTHHFEPEATFPAFGDHTVVELAPRVSVDRKLGAVVRAAATIAACELPRAGEAALLVSSDGLGDLIARRATAPTVVYCHTPLKILHDPEANARLRVLSPRQWWALRFLGRPFNALDRRMWNRFAHAFVNGNEVLRRVTSARLSPAGEIEVLRPGVDTARFRPGQGPRDAFLVAGRIMWQKNIELAIDAYRLARSRGLGSELVIAGAVDEKSDAYLDELHRRATGLPVVFERDPTDERLVALYQRAVAVVFPPLNEDWGIVPLEAMASGAPVIAVDSGGPRESILDGETGWLTEPDPDRFAQLMLHAEQADLDAARSASRARAQLYGWDRLVARIDDVLEALGSGTAIPQRAQDLHEPGGGVVPGP